MPRIRKFFISALALAAASVALAVPASQASAAGGPVDKIMVWGDSMTQIWPGYLDALLPIPVEQRGVGAENIQQTQGHFDEWYRTATPTARANTGHLCWCGHTNLNRANNNPDTILPTLQAMANKVPAGLFMPIGLNNGPLYPKGTNTYRLAINDEVAGTKTAINEKMAQTFGTAYAEVRRWLVTDALARAGITPTAEDRRNMSDDVPPRSLRTDNPGGNPAHLNDTGKQMVASRLNDLVRAAGWIAPTSARLATTTTAITSSMNPAPSTTRVRFSATVTNSSGQVGSPIPTGTVQFSMDGKPYGGAIRLNASGVAITPLARIARGVHSITAVYSGDPKYLSSSAEPYTQTAT